MRINEDSFLKELFKKIPSNQNVLVPPGDDCAVISLNFGKKQDLAVSPKKNNPQAVHVIQENLLLVTVDQLSENIHYYSSASKEPTSGKNAGRKLLARCISDIAAMGGIPMYALVAVSMAPEYSHRWLERFHDGIITLAHTYGISLVGGDLARAQSNVASLTLFGQVYGPHVCLRTQAKPDDQIFTTGEFGGSLLNNKHLLFTPRLKEAQWLVKNGFTRSMIDVSDGLLKDLMRLCQSSTVTAILAEEKIPLSKINNTPVTLEQAYLDGEDYELIFSVSSRNVQFLKDAWPFSTKLTEIGHFIKPKAHPEIINLAGESLPAKYGDGFDHFSS